MEKSMLLLPYFRGIDNGVNGLYNILTHSAGCTMR